MNISKNLSAILKQTNFDDALLYLLACKHDLKYRCSEETFSFLIDQNLIKLNLLTNKIILLTGIYEGEELNLVEVDSSLEEEIKSRVNEYRSLFKGVRNMSMGDKSTVVELLINFCSTYNKTFDEVLDITKYYIANTNPKIIFNADNFICKLDKDKYVSPMYAMFEEFDIDGAKSQYDVL